MVCKLECDGKTFSADDAEYMEYVKKRVGTRVIRNWKKILLRFAVRVYRKIFKKAA